MKLSITIPALDEEETIRQVIEATLAARGRILDETAVEQVEVFVVSDGSTDRTVEYASRYSDQINLVVFERNRGYGAAIKESWNRSDAHLLGFLDADGTCDPSYFADLCSAILTRNADVAVGCRLTPASRMPALRRIGNVLFAWLVSMLALKRIRDTASGMRIVRRSSLEKLMPLPDGLDFTPAMSARIMLAGSLQLVEVDVPYVERGGRSKLRVVRDGLRFLRVILKTAYLHRPTRPLGLVAALLIAAAIGWMFYPTLAWWRTGKVEEWMIYRFLVSHLLALVALMLICFSYLVRKATDIALSDRPWTERYRGAVGYLMSRWWFFFIPLLMVAIGASSVWAGFSEYLTTGEVHQHWSRFILMTGVVSAAAVLVLTKILDACLNLLAAHMQYLREESAGTKGRS